MRARAIGIISTFLSLNLTAGAGAATAPTETLNAFGVFSHDARILADRSWGNLEPGAAPWADNPRALFYLQPANPSWSQKSDADLSAALKALNIPGLSLADQSAVDDQRLAALLQPLVPAPGLRLLSLAGTGVSDHSIALINRFSGLQTLTLNDAITDAGLAKLTLPHLEELNLGKGHITDTGIRALAKLKTLRRLDLGDSAVTAQGLQALAVLHLDQLRLGSPRVDDHAIAALGRLRTLGQLDLAQSHVSDHGLGVLAALPVLHTLFVPTGTTDAGLASIGHLKRLRRLDLSGTAITDAGMPQLSGLVGLEELALTGTAVSDASIGALAQLPKLRTLEITGTRITRAGMDRLAALKSLEVLAFSSKGGVTLQDLKPLHDLTHLRTLVINGRPASFAVLAYFKAAGSGESATALGFSGKGRAPWAESTPVESLPTETLHERRPSISSGLREIHQVESDLDHVVPAVETAQINMQHDTEDNFLGEIEVKAVGHKR